MADLLVLGGRRVLQQRLGEATGPPAEALAAEPDRHALEHQRGQRDAPAAVDGPDLRAGLEVDVVEEDLVEVRLAGDLAERPDRHALGVHRDDEHGQALVLRQIPVGAREQQAVGRVLRVRRPHLLARQPPRAVLLLARPRLDPGQVGARGGLREQLAPHLLGGQHRPEVAVLLVLVAVRDQRRAEHADADDVEDPRHAGAADLLVDHHLIERPEALPAVVRGPGDGGEAALGELALPLAAGVDVVARRRLVLVLVEPGADRGAVLGKLGGVVQIHRGGHATTSGMSLPPEIAEYYDRGEEPERLTRGPEGRLEFLRTQALLGGLLPTPPAAVADIGGGAGIHAGPLAERGYEVHLLDPMQRHVEQAAGLGLASALVGDARELPYEDERFDAAILLGPLYHLPERADRVTALAEARRVVRPGGLVAAAGISRYASTIDGLRGYLDHEGFEAGVGEGPPDRPPPHPRRPPRR